MMSCPDWKLAFALSCHHFNLVVIVLLYSLFKWFRRLTDLKFSKSWMVTLLIEYNNSGVVRSTLYGFYFYRLFWKSSQVWSMRMYTKYFQCLVVYLFHTYKFVDVVSIHYLDVLTIRNIVTPWLCWRHHICLYQTAYRCGLRTVNYF